jgi:transposase-like protein
MGKRKRRKQYTDEFKREAVRLWRESERPIGEIAKELGISQSALSRWAAVIEGPQVEVVDVEETPELELKRLRKRVRELEMEREILKKAATFFAKESE